MESMKCGIFLCIKDVDNSVWSQVWPKKKGNRDNDFLCKHKRLVE